MPPSTSSITTETSESTGATDIIPTDRPESTTETLETLETLEYISTTEVTESESSHGHSPGGECIISVSGNFKTRSKKEFRPENVLNLSYVETTDPEPNYWRPETEDTAVLQFDLGCPMKINILMLVNTNNANKWNRGTRKFRASMKHLDSDDWNEMTDELMDPSRYQPNVYSEYFYFPPSETKQLKFEILSYWGDGGGLQYFNVSFTGYLKYVYIFNRL